VRALPTVGTLSTILILILIHIHWREALSKTQIAIEAETKGT
jgi:hypothetical protein